MNKDNPGNEDGETIFWWLHQYITNWTPPWGTGET